MGKEGKGKSIFALTVHRLLMLIAAVLLVLSYTSTLFNPAKVWVMTIFGLGFLPLLLLNTVLLFWALIRRSKAFIIPLVAIIPAILIFGRYYRSSPKSDTSPDKGAVKIVTYNVGRFSSKGYSSREECASAVMDYLKGLDADVICLQEFYMDDDQSVKPFLKKNFPKYDVEYFVYPTDNGCYGNVTLSRWRLKNKGKIDFKESANLAIYCDYEINDTKYRIYNCHLQSYNISLTRLAKSFKNRSERKKTENKIRHSITMRPRQVGQIMENIEECPYPSILTGDFNDTPLSYTYNRLLRGRKDSFVEAGSGFAATFSMFRPLLRIDYILVPEECEVKTHDVDDGTSFSDHYPVISTFDF